MKTTRSRLLLLSLVLFSVAFALFYPATSFSLVNFDDPVFIIHNPIIFNGFSWDALKSAFTDLHGDECMYVPLLWVSYLMDVKWLDASAANPWGFHFTNVLLHSFNSVFLFLLLYGFCRKPWRAFFFAALWAIHPLRVEPVAWVTSRKDVLSTLFALLCVGSYIWAWMRNKGPKTPPSSPRHTFHLCFWMAFVFFLLGLLVKPMLVTLPFLLLLLDFWPLRRWNISLASMRRDLPRLLLEKLPFFLFAAIAAGAVYVTQTQAISSTPLLKRLWAIPSNYLFYLSKFFLPVRLHAMVVPNPVTWLSFFVAIGILAAISEWVWIRRRTHPGVLVGWLAFLGLLVPVIGVVRIGIHPVADRYAYLPAIGLSIALLGVLPSNAIRCNPRLFRICRTGLAALTLGTLVLLTARHLPSWKDNRSLYDNIERQCPGHYFAFQYRAREALFVYGDLTTAERLADQLLEMQPCVSFGLILKTVCLSQVQSTEVALEFAKEHYPPCDHLGAPGEYAGHLASLYLLAGQFEPANRFMKETFRQSAVEPKTQEQLHALAMLLAYEQGDQQTALDHAHQISALRNRARLVPGDFFISYTTLWFKGYYRQTLPYLLKMAESCSDRPDLLNNIAWLLATTAGSPADPAHILRMVQHALDLSPGHPVILDTLSVAQANAGDFEAAAQTAQNVIAFLETSTASDAPEMLREVRQRLNLFRTRQPYRENPSGRLLYAH